MQRAKHVHRNRDHPSDMSAMFPPDLYHDTTGQPPNAVAPQPGTGPVAVVPYPTVSGQQSQVIHTIPPAFMHNNYLSVTPVVVIICYILNTTSMAISLPVLLWSILVML